MTKYTSHRGAKAQRFRKVNASVDSTNHFIVKNSWQLGRVAQLENSWLIKFRNTLLRLTPASVAEKQIKFIQEVRFDN